MSQILVQESFLKGSMFVPNFMKIERGLDFFLLIWYGMTRIRSNCFGNIYCSYYDKIKVCFTIFFAVENLFSVNKNCH